MQSSKLLIFASRHCIQYRANPLTRKDRLWSSFIHQHFSVAFMWWSCFTVVTFTSSTTIECIGHRINCRLSAVQKYNLSLECAMLCCGIRWWVGKDGWKYESTIIIIAVSFIRLYLEAAYVPALCSSTTPAMYIAVYTLWAPATAWLLAGEPLCSWTNTFCIN